jgi:hypothetical protein
MIKVMAAAFSNQLFDSVFVERIIIEENSSTVVLNCTIFEGSVQYKSDLMISHSGLNNLLCELSARGVDIDLEKHLVPIYLGEDDLMYIIECSKFFDEPVFLPMYAMPEQLVKMRA